MLKCKDNTILGVLRRANSKQRIANFVQNYAKEGESQLLGFPQIIISGEIHNVTFIVRLHVW
ncbi:MAG TPA: hypothetical protein GXX37_12140 [Clostridiaceae bacterium]|nr:hypothetical protein [Clostridiaceae bacterium]